MKEPQFQAKSFKKRFLIKQKSLHSKALILQTLTYNSGIGMFFFKLTIPKILNGRYTDTLRRSLIKYSRRKFHFWYYHNLNKMLTKKPKEIRMGKGKGSFVSWIEKISLHRFLFFFSFF